MLQVITFIWIMLSANNIVIVDFSESNDLKGWYVVNDGVMGGLSQSTFELSDKGKGLFKGKVSLENNGGFASVHYRFKRIAIADAKTLKIRLKGDGKKYQARIYENTSDYFSYIAYFETSGQWETIQIPLNSMYPSFRGRKLDKPNFAGESIEEFTLLIGNKKAESFQLEIEKIELD